MLMGKDAFLRGETLGATQGPLSSFDAVMLAPTQARDLVIWDEFPWPLMESDEPPVKAVKTMGFKD